LLTRLEQHFQGLHADGKRALLIVDEAQNLSPRAVEELRMLSNFQVGTRSLVQSFLVGQPEFRGIMQRPEMRQLKQRVIASYHLGPLDEEETQHYIEHRLRHVGWQDNPQFDVTAFKAVHNTTGGVPRRINTLCDRLLLAAFLGDKRSVTSEDVEAVAKELSDELGGSNESAAPTLADVRTLPLHRPSMVLASSSAMGSAQLATLSSHEERTLQEQIAALEERIELLEASNGVMVNLIRKVLRVLRIGGQTGREQTGS
jgi:hypothetical protein